MGNRICAYASGIAGLVFASVATNARAEDIALPPITSADDPVLSTTVVRIANALLAEPAGEESAERLDASFWLQLAAERTRDAERTIRRLRDIRRPTDPVGADAALVEYELYAKAKTHQKEAKVAFEDAYRRVFREVVEKLDDKAAYYVEYYLSAPGLLGRMRGDLEGFVGQKKTKLDRAEAIDLVKKTELYAIARATESLRASLVAEDDDRRYLIDDQIKVRGSDGATISTTLYRRRGVNIPQPAAFFFSIYTDAGRGVAREAAAHGYVGVVSESRGKRLSPDPISPYEFEVVDTNAVIDWIVHQPWSDGQVGMWGNSYAGFAQWAATKKLHPALKTIAPSAAAIPGFGLPMENNVFLNVNYGWAFYVTDNRFLDEKVYFDRDRWGSLTQRWYESGRPHRELDRVDGTPNPLFQRWLAHPAFDAYWQKMVPYGADYARIKIPVLTITGYYDDGQISAIEYLRQHYQHDPNADHYLLIGPYQHFSAQSPRKPRVVNGYAIDSVAQIDTKAIIFGWMDWVMRGGPKPTLLSDKINFQVMGANEWRHASSLAKTSARIVTFHLSTDRDGPYHKLTERPPKSSGFLDQTVDLNDRKTSTNLYYYPDPVILDAPSLEGAYAFVTEPFAKPVSIDGMIEGEMKVVINKRDFDLNVVFYELMPDGKLFHLSYFVGRASFAKDETRRTLLTPGKLESIPFKRMRMTSRRMSTGSRLLVVVNVNKNPFAQVNYGTGKDVADESIADGKEPLHVRWSNASTIRVQMTP
jgi:putative CocE/NonD family hydrolase